MLQHLLLLIWEFRVLSERILNGQAGKIELSNLSKTWHVLEYLNIEYLLIMIVIVLHYKINKN